MKKYSVILLNALPDKKIKYLGNKCLIKFKGDENIFDHYIKMIKKIFTNFEIILVCAFDNKKIKKYVEKNYPDVKYLEHNLTDTINIGHSLTMAFNCVNNKNCLIIDTSNIILPQAIKQIKISLNKTFILVGRDKDGTIGFIENNGYISNCYYGLPKKIYDIIYIEESQFDTVKELTSNISNMFFFEVINKYIDKGVKIVPLTTNNIKIMTSIQKIKEIKKQLC
jgi:hypothetical protein